MKISAESYYDFSPGLENASGDIWSSFPTHDLLTSTPVAAVVITPACDLAQGKVSTITYLPIIPLRSYFSIPDALPEVVRALEGQLAVANVKGLLGLPEGYALPTVSTLAAAESLLAEQEAATKIGQKELAAFRRAAAGVRILKKIIRPGLSEIGSDDLILLFGEKEWPKIKAAMVKNSFRSDIHFLPADGQRPEWAGVLRHSLVLFRYPLSAPIEILESAQDVNLSDWENWCSITSAHTPIAKGFGSERPMKRLGLKDDFLSDLLTRFVALFVRLGSPDFSSETVTQYALEIDL